MLGLVLMLIATSNQTKSKLPDCNCAIPLGWIHPITQSHRMNPASQNLSFSLLFHEKSHKNHIFCLQFLENLRQFGESLRQFS
jgi:hypothetical protein